MRIVHGLVLLVALAAWSRADDAPATAPPAAPQFEGRTATEWTSQLASPDVKLRQKAAYGLFKLGPDAKGAAAALVAALGDADDYVRTTAAKAIPRLPQDDVRAALPALAAWMSDDRETVRREAASLLWRLGPLAAHVVPELTKALGSADDVVRAKAAWCLGNAGAAGSAALGALTKSAADPAEDVRKGAANAIALIDPATAFASERASVRLAALQAYGDWPKNKEWADPVIVAGVLKSIEDRDEEVRSWAAHALDTFAVFAGDDRPVAWIQVFRRVLETQRSPGPRAAAAAGLGRYKGHGPEVVPALVEAAKSREPQVRSAAIDALGCMGEESKSAVALVLRSLHDEDALIRSAASRALGLLGDSSEAVLDGLASALSDSDRSVRLGAIVSLGALGKGAARVEPVLTKRLLDAGLEPYECIEIAHMLVFDGTETDAIVTLTSAFERDAKSPLSVSLALRALDAPCGEKALASIVSALTGGTDPKAVLTHLWMLGPKAVSATSAVVPFLSDEDAQVRITAAVALGAFGPAAKDAIPALERLAKDADPNVALAATQALDAIRAPGERPSR